MKSLAELVQGGLRLLRDLTVLLETIISRRKDLDAYEPQWLALRDQVIQERRQNSAPCEPP